MIHTNFSVGVFDTGVSKESGGEAVGGVADEEAGPWSVEEVWVGFDTLVEAVGGVFEEDIQRVVGVFGIFLQVVQVHEVVHVHVVVVTISIVEIATGDGGVDFKDVVGVYKTARSTC